MFADESISVVNIVVETSSSRWKPVHRGGKFQSEPVVKIYAIFSSATEIPFSHPTVVIVIAAHQKASITLVNLVEANSFSDI